MKRALYTLFGLAAAAAIALWALGPSSKNEAASAALQPQPVAVVTEIAAATTTWPQLIEAQGAITPWQEAVVGARVSGLTLIDVGADVGDVVTAGQVLARYDSRTVQAEITQAEANLAQARATLKQAEVNRDRVLALGKSSAISEQDILQAVTSAETGKAQADSAAAALESLQIRLEDTRIVAPDDGIIMSRSATLGQVSQPGSELFRMIRQGRLEWRAQLNAAQFAEAKIGMAVKLTLPDGSSASGQLRQLAAALDEQTRLGLAYVDLAPGSNARAGMFASGRLELASSPAIVVPAASLVIRDGRSLLFRLTGDIVQELVVNPGRRQGQLVEVDSVVAPGDRIVLKGAGFLNDGDLVKVVPDTSSAQTDGES